MIEKLFINTSRYISKEYNGGSRIPLTFNLAGDYDAVQIKILTLDYTNLALEPLAQELIEKIANGYTLAALESVELMGHRIGINNMSNESIDFLCSIFESGDESFKEVLNASEITLRYYGMFNEDKISSFLIFVFANVGGYAEPYLFIRSMDSMAPVRNKYKRQIVDIEGRYEGFDNVVKYDEKTNMTKVITYVCPDYYKCFDIARIKYMNLFDGNKRIALHGDKKIRFDELKKYSVSSNVPNTYSLVAIEGNDEGGTSTALMLYKQEYSEFIVAKPILLSMSDILYAGEDVLDGDVNV